MSRDDVRVLDRLRSRRWAIFAVWVAVLLVSFAAGGATLGLLVDYEAVGTEEDPNTLEVVGNWANDAGATGNDEPAGNAGTPTPTPTATPTPTPTATPTPTPTATPTPTPTATPTPDCPGRSERSGGCPPGRGTGGGAS